MKSIDTEAFVGSLATRGLSFWVGVPDSLLKDLCACASYVLGDSFYICANEGNAIGAACGWYVGTGKAAVVYMQNSGEGNAINPLLSLADRDVYSIPMLMIIGWRGEPGSIDEPQHIKQGKVTTSLLETLDIPYVIIDTDSWKEQLDYLLRTMFNQNRPVAIVIRKGVFESYAYRIDANNSLSLTREEALKTVLNSISLNDLVVSTTGKESREVFEIREQRHQTHQYDFLTVGGMGHTLSIAWGLALAQPDRLVWCLDGDGSMLMHLGSLAVYGQVWPRNLRYIVNINGAHESVGGQPNAACTLNVSGLLASCGLGDAVTANTEAEIDEGMAALLNSRSFALILKTRQGSRDDLGRPTSSPLENKLAMMRALGVAYTTDR